MTNPATDTVNQFIETHGVSPVFAESAHRAFLPLLRELPLDKARKAPLVLGINGAQGTGKSTLAAFLAFAARRMKDLNVAVLSLDDFYLTRDERRQLARDLHPLFATRGVPGTHDIKWLTQSLDSMLHLKQGASVTLPRFDKLKDERCHEKDGRVVCGPFDLIVLEGWCVGSMAQETAELLEPVNDLERNEDPQGIWRTHVNEKLKTLYEPLFREIDLLLFLRAPSFGAIHRWRSDQEQKLAAKSPPGPARPMNAEEIQRFMQFFERLTRHNLSSMPARADVLFALDEAHRVC